MVGGLGKRLGKEMGRYAGLIKNLTNNQLVESRLINLA